MSYWFTNWLGARYSDEYDCAAFFADVQRQEFGRDLVLPQDEALTPAFIRRHWPPRWAKTDDPKDGDAVLMKGVKGYHLGVAAKVLKHLVVVHNSQMAGGVFLSTLPILAKQMLAVEGYYRWNKP